MQMLNFGAVKAAGKKVSIKISFNAIAACEQDGPSSFVLSPPSPLIALAGSQELHIEPSKSCPGGR